MRNAGILKVVGRYASSAKRTQEKLSTTERRNEDMPTPRAANFFSTKTALQGRGPTWSKEKIPSRNLKPFQEIMIR